MLRSAVYSFAGSRHQDAGRPNEDAAAERVFSAHRAVALCDGAGQCSHGKAAAELTADAAAGYLALHFERCLLEPEDVLRRELVQAITKVLTGAARQAGAGPSQFGCTVLAAAMDGLGRWCMFHLGDGACFGRLSPDAEWETVSLPQRGLKAGSTSLTMNGPMFKNLRFYRQTDPTPRVLMMMTDGGMELFSSKPALSELPKLVKARAVATVDDCSVAWLEAGP